MRRTILGMTLLVVGNTASIYTARHDHWLAFAGAVVLCGAGGWFLGGSKK